MSLEPLSAPLRAHTLLWFETSQLPRLQRPGQLMPCWLHGFATRNEAEELLRNREQGCYLIRLSESRFGFVLSYRGKDRCRHFIIEEKERDGAGRGGGLYFIVGEKSCHGSLQELIDYYMQHPIGLLDEVITVPFVQQSRGSKDVLSEETGGQGVGIKNTYRDDRTAQTGRELSNDPSKNSPTEVTAKYAMLRKALKKCHSLPETHEKLEVPNVVLTDPQGFPTAEDSPGTLLVAESRVVMYARVNKHPRASSTVPKPSLNTPAGSHVTLLSSPDGASLEQQCREMVPMHTCEETGHLTPKAESLDQIELNAGWQRRVAVDSVVNSQNYVYSEINQRGKGDVSTMECDLPGMVPNRPPRPPRSIHCPSRLDGKLQQLDSGRRQGQPRLPPHPDEPVPEPNASTYAQVPERRVLPQRPLPDSNRLLPEHNSSNYAQVPERRVLPQRPLPDSNRLLPEHNSSNYAQVPERRVLPQRPLPDLNRLLPEPNSSTYEQIPERRVLPQRPLPDSNRLLPESDASNYAQVPERRVLPQRPLPDSNRLLPEPNSSTYEQIPERRVLPQRPLPDSNRPLPEHNSSNYAQVPERRVLPQRPLPDLNRLLPEPNSSTYEQIPERRVLPQRPLPDSNRLLPESDASNYAQVPERRVLPQRPLPDSNRLLPEPNSSTYEQIPERRVLPQRPLPDSNRLLPESDASNYAQVPERRVLPQRPLPDSNRLLPEPNSSTYEQIPERRVLPQRPLPDLNRLLPEHNSSTYEQIPERRVLPQRPLPDSNRLLPEHNSSTYAQVPERRVPP